MAADRRCGDDRINTSSDVQFRELGRCIRLVPQLERMNAGRLSAAWIALRPAILEDGFSSPSWGRFCPPLNLLLMSQMGQIA